MRVKGMNARVAVIAAAMLGGLVALAALLWEYPRLLLYLLLGLIGVLAYAAIYLIVSAKVRREEEPQARPPLDDADQPAQGQKRDSP
jgi:hypothetical protein